jgi:hypothetical protein
LAISVKIFFCSAAIFLPRWFAADFLSTGVLVVASFGNQDHIGRRGR